VSREGHGYAWVEVPQLPLVFARAYQDVQLALLRREAHRSGVASAADLRKKEQHGSLWARWTEDSIWPSLGN
jgi:hypothetical protein